MKKRFIPSSVLLVVFTLLVGEVVASATGYLQHPLGRGLWHDP